MPIPVTCPEGFKLLIKQCLSNKPKNRPSFRIILSHLEIAAVELLNNQESYSDKQKSWQVEIKEKLQTSINNSSKIHEHEKVGGSLVSMRISSFILILGFNKKTSRGMETRKGRSLDI